MRARIISIVLAASFTALAGCSGVMVDGYQAATGYEPTYDPYLAELRRQNDLLERQTDLAEREEKEAARERRPKLWPGTSIPMGEFRDKEERAFYRERARETEEFKRKNAGWMARVDCATARRKAGDKNPWEACK